MTRLFQTLKQLVFRDDGPTAVEYAIMLALIVIVCLAAIRTIGTETNTTLETVSSELGDI